MVISVNRKERRSERVFRGLMIALAVVFLLGGIMLSTSLMLPCLLTAGAYYWYAHASRREFEYTLEEGRMRIERVSDWGRKVLHEFPLDQVLILARPDDPCVARYKKGGEEKIPRFDYTSYDENTPYYTMIVLEDERKIKLLLDLTKEAIHEVRAARREAVRC